VGPISDLLRTNGDVALAILRVVLGIVFFAHGAQKVLGWFGGYSFADTVKGFREQMGIPRNFWAESALFWACWDESQPWELQPPC
jgi:putative oxidoreductase